MKKAVRILAVAVLVALCASCTKTSSKCKCTSIIVRNGEEISNTVMEVENPGRCSDLNSNISGTSTGGDTQKILTCVEI